MNRIMVGRAGVGSARRICISAVLFISTLSLASGDEHRLVINRLATPGPPPIMWHESLESGWQASRTSGRPMLIFITSDHCDYCDAMKSSTWCESSIRDRVGSGFVAIRLKRDRNKKSLSRVKVAIYPTTLIGTPEGKVIGKRFGYQPPSRLHQLLSEAGDRMVSRRGSVSQVR